MSTAQCLELVPTRHRGEPAHALRRPGLPLRSLTGFGSLLGLLFLGPVGGLAAQSRGDLQVGARVLPAGPSQAALATALNRPAAGDHPELADIRRELRSPNLDSTGAALRPRAVVTISFLRN